MTLPLGQLALRERSARCSLVDGHPESKGFRHRIGNNPLTLRARGACRDVTGALQLRRREPPRHSSAIVTVVIATGESGMSRLLRGAPTILSTTSMPLVTWPKIV